jgi:hypothetical protein
MGAHVFSPVAGSFCELLWLDIVDALKVHLDQGRSEFYSFFKAE